MGTPQRHYDRDGARRMRAVGQAVGDITALCVSLQHRIRHIRRNTQCGSYLLADSEGFVYILRNESGHSDRIVNELSRMIVGLYVVVPDAEQIAEDLKAHLSL